MLHTLNIPKTHIYDLDSVRRRAQKVFREMFENVCQSIQGLDGNEFVEHCWTRDKNGILIPGENSDDAVYVDRVLHNGSVLEKVGVNYVAIEGELPPGMTFQKSGALITGEADRISSDSGTPYFATGASFVIHPRNPMVPIAHANYRYFQVGDATQPSYWWFGGGSDLTPSYLFEEDVVHFHKVHKSVCDQHDPSYYARFKKWCDDYFFIRHRGETRGIGGIFFDHLNDYNPQKILAFITDCSEAFVHAYMPIVEKRKDMPFTKENKYWQRLVSGRYVEFILTSDRGIRFGLESGMVSQQSVFNCMPPGASWQYDDQPSPGSEEAMLREVLKNTREWV